MSEIKHTPGPWKVVESGDNNGYYVRKDEKDYYLGETIICSEINQGYDVGKSDAKLIAAAPELLKALERLITWVDPVKFPDAILDAKEVIKKATT